ncbi:hypothetical protein PanWU01x14_047660 [Parasponia andersonii]|uniref:Retrotransposon gag domain-containing protein n=1 Tax=Parasponia andersonii TaxID=3476 RepID=A0A2P5DN43_PARAD|nr:hypothetical protein PanWU01x14_047660 [Parasponia andersonii]
MAPSRMTTRSTHPDAEGSSREARPDLEQKLDQMLAALTESNRKAEMAHKAILGLRNEVAEVHRDNTRLEGLLVSEARSKQREDFDEEVQQEFGSQPRGEVPAPSGSRMQGARQSQTRPLQTGVAMGRRRHGSPRGTPPDWKQEIMAELSKRLGAYHSQTPDDLAKQTVREINWTIFADWIQIEPRPRDFTTPTFKPFEGKTDHLDHIYHFQQKMFLETRDEAVACKDFSMTLVGSALLWFRQLLRNS